MLNNSFLKLIVSGHGLVWALERGPIQSMLDNIYCKALMSPNLKWKSSITYAEIKAGKFKSKLLVL